MARNFVHQVVALEELQRRGVRVVFCDRPLSDDPHEQLVTQIRGAVAEYEQTLSAERMRRGRQARLPQRAAAALDAGTLRLPAAPRAAP